MSGEIRSLARRHFVFCFGISSALLVTSEDARRRVSPEGAFRRGRAGGHCYNEDFLGFSAARSALTAASATRREGDCAGRGATVTQRPYLGDRSVLGVAIEGANKHQHGGGWQPVSLSVDDVTPSLSPSRPRGQPLGRRRGRRRGAPSWSQPRGCWRGCCRGQRRKAPTVLPPSRVAVG